MVVNKAPRAAPPPDLAHLALFLGLRVNQLVMERMRAAGFRNVRESHGYVIQHLIERERSITELASRMGVTQQAASRTVAGMIQTGILESVPGADRRAKTIRLSKQGWEGVEASRRARKAIRARLIRHLGKGEYEALSARLSGCLEVLGGLKTVASRRVRAPE
jgi:DNA-binding MarR family transcriptional regulator